MQNPGLTENERKAREAFIAAKRHDLRTPINAIIGYSEMLREDALDAGKDALSRDLDRIVGVGKSLLEPIAVLLDRNRIRNGEIDLADLSRLGGNLRRAMQGSLETIAQITDRLIEEAQKAGDGMMEEDLGRVRSSADQMFRVVDEIAGHSEAGAQGTTASDSDPADSGLYAGLEATLRRLEQRPEETAGLPGHVLVVDDNELNRDVLLRRLEREGHRVSQASDGRQALEVLSRASFDLVLLDVLMPVMDGIEVLQRIKNQESLRHIPVVMLSALDEFDSVVRCIQVGADDYLAKPFNPVLLKARIGACLERKRFRDREREYLRQIQAEREKSESLLLNILPAPIAEQLKRSDRLIADGLSDVTVLFSDLVGFTGASSRVAAPDLVGRLNEIVSTFDYLAIELGVEKIKTIGDAYMVVSGAPEPQSDHADRMAQMALRMMDAIARLNAESSIPFEIRIGMNSGPVVAGVIGARKFTYDLWGDTVNTASRMESHGAPGRVQVSESTYELLKGRYSFEPRGTVDIKGKGPMQTYFLLGPTD